MSPYYHILLVEDDSFLAHSLQKQLSERDRKIFIATSLDSAYAKIDQQNFDLIILDRHLPDGDGLSVLQYVAGLTLQTKVLILSQKGDVPERIRGLVAGADDYLPKPFSVEELILRVKLLLEKVKQPRHQVLSAQNAVFYPEIGVVEVGGERTSLRRRESQILSCLLRRKNSVVNRNTIIRYVWGTEPLPAASTLDVYVRRLRMALKHQLEIKTVRGFGFMIADHD